MNTPKQVHAPAQQGKGGRKRRSRRERTPESEVFADCLPGIKRSTQYLGAVDILQSEKARHSRGRRNHDMGKRTDFDFVRDPYLQLLDLRDDRFELHPVVSAE